MCDFNKIILKTLIDPRPNIKEVKRKEKVEFKSVDTTKFIQDSTTFNFLKWMPPTSLFEKKWYEVKKNDNEPFDQKTNSPIKWKKRKNWNDKAIVQID